MKESQYYWLRLIWSIIVGIIIIFFFLQILKGINDINENLDNIWELIYWNLP